MGDGVLILFDDQQRRALERMFQSFGRSLGAGDLSVSIGPGGEVSVSRVDRRRSAPVAREQFAVVRLTAADATDAWKYEAEEVIGNDLDADPPTYVVKNPGRTWGVDSEDEGLVIHPGQIEGLETTATGADPVYVVRRVVVDGDLPRWVIVGAAGDSLPDPGLLYQVLQLQGSPDLLPVWDYPRCHA